MRKQQGSFPFIKSWTPIWGLSFFMSFATPLWASSTWKQIDEESMRALEHSLGDIQDQGILYNAKKRLADFYANKSKFSESEGLAQKQYRKQAIRYYSEALQLSRKDEAEIRLQKAALLSEDKKIPEALRELDAIINSESSESSLRLKALKLRAYAWISQFDWEKADRDFTRIEAMGSEHLDEKDDHQWAWAKIYLKKEDAAIKLWQRAIHKAEKKGLLAKEIYLDALLFQWRSGRLSKQHMLKHLSEAPQAIRADLAWALAEEATRLGQKDSARAFYQFFMGACDPQDSRKALADFRAKPLTAEVVRAALESLKSCSAEDPYCRELRKEIKNRILDEHRLVKTHPNQRILQLYLTYLDFVSDAEMLEVASAIAAYLDEESTYSSLVSKLLSLSELSDAKKEQILSDYLAHAQQLKNKAAKIQAYQFYLKQAKPSKAFSLVLFDLTQLYHSEKLDRDVILTSSRLIDPELQKALSKEQKAKLWDMRFDARYRLDDLQGFEQDLQVVARQFPEYHLKAQERFEKFLLEKASKVVLKSSSDSSPNPSAEMSSELNLRLKNIAQSSVSLPRRQKAHLLVWLQLKKNQRVDQEIPWLQNALQEKNFLEEAQQKAYVQRLFLLYWLTEDFMSAWRLSKTYDRELGLPLEQKAQLTDAAGDQKMAVQYYRILLENSKVSSPYRLFAVQRILSLTPVNFEEEKKLFLRYSKNLSVRDRDEWATLLLLRDGKHHTWLKKHITSHGQAALVVKRQEALKWARTTPAACLPKKNLQLKDLLRWVKSTQKELASFQAEGMEVVWLKRAGNFETCLLEAVQTLKEKQVSFVQELVAIQNELLGQIQPQIAGKHNILLQRWRFELESLRPEFISLVDSEIRMLALSEGQNLLAAYQAKKKEFQLHRQSNSSSLALEKKIQLETQFGNPARANLLKQVSAQVNKEI